MRKLYGIAIALAAIMLLSPVAAGFNISDSEIDEEIPISLNASEPAFDENMVDISSMSNDSLIQSIGQIESEAILSIDSVSMAQINSASAESIKSAIINGTPLVLSGDSSSLNALDGMSIVMDKNADVTVIYCDPLTKNLHYFTVDSENNAQTIAMDWLNSKIAERNANKSQSASSTASNDVGNVFTASAYIDGHNGSTLTIDKTYTRVGTSSTEKYYQIRYDLKFEPNLAQNIYNADAYVISDIKKLNTFQRLVTHSPSGNVSGVKDSEINVNLDIFKSDAGFSYSDNWVYSISEVLVKDRSTSNCLDIWHDIAPGKSSSVINYVASPGAIVAVQNGSNYYVEDVYKVTFCTPYHGIWPWDPDYHYYTNETSQTIELTI